ncbi:MAG: GGDEF domain-containing protein [Clostridia bacterium]|nr:GGDEF domain-containing protein [Clostridia bacterium]
MILFSLLLTLLYFALPFSAAAVGAEAEQHQKVRVGWYISERFQEGEAEQDRKSGYSYEYLQDVANYTGWEYEYVPGGWSELYDALLNGEIDLLAGLSFTEERAALLNYPAYEMGLESYYIYKRAGNEDISGIDLSTLNGKRVGTLRNNLMTEFFEAWMEDTGITCEEVLFNDFETRDKAFADGSIDALIAVNNNVASNSGFTPVVAVGESSYYLGVAKGRTDLLDQLNKALAALKESNPFFIQSLQLKYFSHTAVNAALSREESEWVAGHSSIRVGCLDDCMPYCDIDEDGTVRGVLSDVFREWLSQLGLSGKIVLEYRAYPRYDDLIAALRSGEVDVAFPVYDSIWSSEKLGIVQTGSVLESGVHIAFRGEYSDRTTTERIAVSKRSEFQQTFAEVNYPESDIYTADTPEDCLEAVKQGKATCAFLDSGHAETLLSKRSFRTLNRMALGESISFCMGVKKGNNVLYSLLSRGLSLIDKSIVTNAIYEYISSDIEYSLYDFLFDHPGLVLAVVLIIAGLVVVVKLVQHQAAVDGLTHFGNKRAYQNAVKQLKKRIKENRAEFALAVFDLNGLKAINDTYGHDAGDRALTDAGRVLKKVFGNARLYRYGGDEFIAIEMNSSLEEIRQRFGLLDWELEEVNRAERPYVLPLSLAKGAAAFIPETDTDFNRVFERADQAMYEDKRMYYEKHNDRRKKQPTQ